MTRTWLGPAVLTFSLALASPSDAALIEPPEGEEYVQTCQDLIATIDLQGDPTNTDSYRIKLAGGWGYSVVTDDRVSNAFARFAAKADAPVLEVAAGVGSPSRAALKLGAKEVIANDLFRRNLNWLFAYTPPEHRSRLKLDLGRFPDELHYEPGSLSGVFFGRFLHFFDDDTVQKYLSIVLGWLKPGGQVFIDEDSPFLGGAFERARVEYEERARRGLPHPGEFPNPELFFPHRGGALANGRLVVLRNADEWMNLLRNAGFHVWKSEIFYISRRNFPEDMLFDGREGIGAIGRKPAVRRGLRSTPTVLRP